jgi:predicted RNase H-like HicB family nuclease
MTNTNQGHFYVGELPDGRFVAASSAAPYFCFRAESEEAVLAKVSKALTFFGSTQSANAKVKIKSVTQTVTTLRPTRKVPFAEVKQLAAA